MFPSKLEKTKNNFSASQHGFRRYSRKLILINNFKKREDQERLPWSQVQSNDRRERKRGGDIARKSAATCTPGIRESAISSSDEPPQPCLRTRAASTRCSSPEFSEGRRCHET